MGNRFKTEYKIIVRVGEKAGTFERGDDKPILTLGAAHVYAEDLVPQATEVVILKQEVMARIKGGLPEGLSGDGPKKPE